MEAGADYLDAPVSGGEVGAREGSLSIMVGGNEACFTRALPLFKCVGKNVVHVGGAGAGQIAKIANQIIVGVTIKAVGEALLLASKAGADPRRVRSALMGGFASSKILEVQGSRMLDRTFDPGFKIALHQKDLKNALEAAKALGLALPALAACQQLFNSAEAHGLAEKDHSALVCALEVMAAHKL
jgi:2-hydroxy-3-oxopropionate reductase